MQEQPRVLVVDDEAYIVELVRFNLEKEGYQVDEASNGLAALDIVKGGSPPDLIVLDIMLPEMDGLQVCRHLKQDPTYNAIPIIMLTARGEELDTVLGLEMGADDYIKKPFSPRELVARVNARLRAVRIHVDRARTTAQAFRYRELLILPDDYVASFKGEKMDLTLKEYELLNLLTVNQGKVVKRDTLMEQIWGYEFTGDTRTVDVHIRHLRQKLNDDPNNPEYIETVRGVGYRFVAGSNGRGR